MADDELLPRYSYPTEYGVEVTAGDDGLISVTQRPPNGKQQSLFVSPARVETLVRFLRAARTELDGETVDEEDDDLDDEEDDLLDDASSIGAGEAPFRDALLRLTEMMHLVFENDWDHTQTLIAEPPGRHIAPDGSFLSPGVADESNDWANRGTLLAAYRDAVALLKAAGSDPTDITRIR